VNSFILVVPAVGRQAPVPPGNGEAGVPGRPRDEDVANVELQLGKQSVEAIEPRPESLARRPLAAEGVLSSERVRHVGRTPVEQGLRVPIREVLERIPGDASSDGVVHDRV
jgi:hypothetical protein